MAKYIISGSYYFEQEIETDLVGDELFHYYANILESEETKKKVMLTRGLRLFVCKCKKSYDRHHDKYCSRCGEILVDYDKPS